MRINFRSHYDRTHLRLSTARSERRKCGSMSVITSLDVGFTYEVSDYLVVHTGPEERKAKIDTTDRLRWLNMTDFENNLAKVCEQDQRDAS